VELPTVALTSPAALRETTQYIKRGNIFDTGKRERESRRERENRKRETLKPWSLRDRVSVLLISQLIPVFT
jgi:hypothetical protein